jgi:hypothetical protein
MRHALHSLLSGAALAVLLSTPAAGQRYPPLRSFPEVRVWSVEQRDMYRRGETLRVFFQTSDHAFVAVLRIDTRGHVELLFPLDPRDDGYVRGRVPYPVHTHRSDGWRIDEPPGIAYIFAIAAPEPLDVRALWRGPQRGRQLWSLYGDPFHEMERIAALLVRSPYHDRYPPDGRAHYDPRHDPRYDPRYPLYSLDAFSYFVDGRHDYPSYACYDVPPRGPAHLPPTYPDCTWLRESLRGYDDYYDTRRYSGPRDFFDRRPRREDLRRQ